MDNTLHSSNLSCHKKSVSHLLYLLIRFSYERKNCGFDFQKLLLLQSQYFLAPPVKDTFNQKFWLRRVNGF
jgi:hypothetical protein